MWKKCQVHKAVGNETNKRKPIWEWIGNEGKTKYRVRVCEGERKRLGEERRCHVHSRSRVWHPCRCSVIMASTAESRSWLFCFLLPLSPPASPPVCPTLYYETFFTSVYYFFPVFVFVVLIYWNLCCFEASAVLSHRRFGKWIKHVT